MREDWFSQSRKVSLWGTPSLEPFVDGSENCWLLLVPELLALRECSSLLKFVLLVVVP